MYEESSKCKVERERERGVREECLVVLIALDVDVCTSSEVFDVDREARLFLLLLLLFLLRLFLLVVFFVFSRVAAILAIVYSSVIFIPIILLVVVFLPRERRLQLNSIDKRNERT